MSAVNAATAPIAIFGDLDGDVWGVLIGGDQPRVAAAALTGADVALLPAELDLDDGEVWTLTAAGCVLRIERAAADTATGDGGEPLEPCRVSGSVTIDGTERELDVGGVRAATLGGESDGSLRLFGAWFAGGHELGLLSLRPGGAKGHDHDRISVAARGEEHALVLDPRLSTTYDQHEAPRRVGLELWLSDDEDSEEQAPRRVAGLATGSRVEDSNLSAYAFRCSSRGENGAGVYLLLRRDGE